MALRAVARLDIGAPALLVSFFSFVAQDLMVAMSSHLLPTLLDLPRLSPHSAHPHGYTCLHHYGGSVWNERIEAKNQ